MQGVAVVLVVLVAGPAAAQSSGSLLNSVFQDRVVLQRNSPVSVWGQARAGETVTVTVAGATVTAEADSDGGWSAELPSIEAGGPYELVARSSSGKVQVLSDVLVGDVYLCSGQSNMALPVHRTLNSRAEIQNASNDRIRMLTVGQVSSPEPLATLPDVGTWETASPETVGDWSATCYYFARELQPNVNVPIGLIHSSWGGSSISAWMSAGALSRVGGHEESLSLLKQYTEDRPAAQQSFGEKWEAWWRDAAGGAEHEAPWQPESGTSWSTAPKGLGNWKAWGRSGLQSHNGMVWFRTTVELTAAQAERGAVLSLGSIDEIDQTWINGHVVGSTFGWGTPRTYSIPAEQLEEGENVIVVNVLNSYGAGGMLGDPSQRALLAGNGERLSLDPWRYRKAREDLGSPPRTPWQSVGGLSTLHNAMVAPLRDYSLRGAVWYQGESDTGSPEDYRKKLDALMAQWRRQFTSDLPVLVVQLANYGTVPTAPTASNWAQLREAQRLATTNDPNAGLAVTIDIGTPYDIHPPNKQELGRRLTRAARHVVYGEDIPPSGPVPEQAIKDGDTVTVPFTGVQGGLVARGHSDPIGFELCTGEGDCRYAEAQIDGRRVHLNVEPGAEPSRVRYCWADSPVCTLYDGSGLPAGPFEIRVSGE